MDEYMVEVERLDSILERHLPAGTSLDLLAVDAEGTDLDVLKSNDWQRFRPMLVIVEVSDSGPRQLLSDLGYVVVAEVPVLGRIRDLVFVDPEQRVYRDAL